MSGAPPELVVASSDDELAALGAELLGRAIDGAVRARGRALVALSGGSTPGPVYRALTELALPWGDVVFAWVDERAVPPDHPRSNYRAAWAELELDGKLRAATALRMRGGEADLEAEARRYEARLRELFGVARAVAFDAVVLGVGDDGHTASLFPGTNAMEESTRLVVANHVEKLQAWRVTMTFPVFEAAQRVMFLVAGADKAAMVRSATVVRPSAATPPAGRVRPRGGSLVWLVDAAAGAKLPAPGEPGSTGPVL